MRERRDRFAWQAGDFQIYPSHETAREARDQRIARERARLAKRDNRDARPRQRELSEQNWQLIRQAAEEAIPPTAELKDAMSHPAFTFTQDESIW
jgi:hypothetical protein